MGLDCPACHQEWAGEVSSDKPVHLSLLEDQAKARNRFVSTSGPAEPDETPGTPPEPAPSTSPTPGGWMARLEAAREVARDSGGVGVDTATAHVGAEPQGAVAIPTSKIKPPPLKARASTPPVPPAHLLVAQLEADEASRRDEEAQNFQQLLYEHPSQDIAKVSVDVPRAPPKKRRVPDSVIVGLLGGLVLVGLGVVWTAVDREPAPEVAVDPALREAAEKKKAAIRALERGHTLAAQGTKKAKAALRAYRRALSLDPKLASAERGMAVVYAARNDDARAVRHYRRYLKLAPKAGDAADVRRIIRAYERAQRKR